MKAEKKLEIAKEALIEVLSLRTRIKNLNGRLTAVKNEIENGLRQEEISMAEAKKKRLYQDSLETEKKNKGTRKKQIDGFLEDLILARGAFDSDQLDFDDYQEGVKIFQDSRAEDEEEETEEEEPEEKPEKPAKK